VSAFPNYHEALNGWKRLLMGLTEYEWLVIQQRRVDLKIRRPELEKEADSFLWIWP
jgi:hypothetical protein